MIVKVFFRCSSSSSLTSRETVESRVEATWKYFKCNRVEITRNQFKYILVYSDQIKLNEGERKSASSRRKHRRADSITIKRISSFARRLSPTKLHWKWNYLSVILVSSKCPGRRPCQSFMKNSSRKRRTKDEILINLPSSPFYLESVAQLINVLLTLQAFKLNFPLKSSHGPGRGEDIFCVCYAINFTTLQGIVLKVIKMSIKHKTGGEYVSIWQIYDSR